VSLSNGYLRFVKWWRPGAGRLAEALVQIALPTACASCGRPGNLICDQCRSSMQWLKDHFCSRCGRPRSRSSQSCRSCSGYPHGLVRIRAALLFSGPLRKVIHRYKYDGLFALARPLAELMALAWPTWQMPSDLVLPIPLHPRRQRRRGFNQSLLLLNELGRRLGWDCRPEAIQRDRYTSPQTNLARVERLENVRGAFRADPVLVGGKRILLIDDVYTTGSTLSAASEALLEAGAHSVSAYCLSVAVETSTL